MKHKMEKFIGLTLTGWTEGSDGHLAELRFDNNTELYLNCITKVVAVKDDDTDDLIDTMLALDCPKIIDASHDGDNDNRAYEFVFENNGLTTTIQLFDHGDDECGFMYEE